MKLEITGNNLRATLCSDPFWTEKLDKSAYQEVIVTTFANLNYLGMKKLSPKLTFRGLEPNQGFCASFNNCENLESAHAYFEGNVDFSKSGLKTTEGIKINPLGMVNNTCIAKFNLCPNLTIATGEWPGAVDFSESGITKVKNLVIQQANSKGVAAFFHNCKQLQSAEGEFQGSLEFTGSAITETQNLKILKPDINGNAASYKKCEKLTVADGLYHGCVDFSQSGVTNISPNLKILGANKYNEAASFYKCDKLKTATGHYQGTIDFSESSINKIKHLTVDMDPHEINALFVGCQHLEIASGSFSGTVDFSQSNIKRIIDLTINPKTKEQHKTNPIILILKNCNSLRSIPTNFDPNTIIANEKLIENLTIKKHFKNTLKNKDEEKQDVYI